MLEELEANELLALLANLGAQQQAVLAAIAGKHQGSQRAADRRQPEGMAFPSGLSTSRPNVNISAAAGESAAAAQQQKPEQKPWRVPGGQFAFAKMQPLLVSPLCITDFTSPYDSLSPSLATFDFPVFLSISTDLSLCPASYLGASLSVACSLAMRPWFCPKQTYFC